MPADLARDTAVSRLGPAPALGSQAQAGRYSASLSDSWSFRNPSGGVLMSIALRAMEIELGDPALLPTSATTLFCTPVPAGPLEIRVEVLRHGNAAAQLRAALTSTLAPGPGLEVSATFVREREGPDVLDAIVPEHVPPERAPPIREPVPAPFYENFDMRLGFGQPWWEPDWPIGQARAGRWMRYLIPQRRADGRFDPLAIPPIVDLMPTALIQKLGPDRPRMSMPSLDLTVHFVDHTSSEWILTTTHARRSRAGVAEAEVEVWDDRGRLIATATQMMMLRRWKPRP